ncbi:outer membrane beta-barrel protein [Sebaldella sp. S0638]|uniref:outer membrane beta-barrel protein n=1 Tax=Sebaldella sp. S0638 TaxID=2957809 RepID=UPI0020A1F1E1|nr:outer membrane beta-barrel protein [Sebaldella sp. S0638]MCP1226071.1 porin family protein [Sebaldella sp. S0638]
MKKKLLIVGLIGSLAFAGHNVIEVRGGYDLSSSTNFDKDIYSEYDLDKFVESGFHFGVEYRREILTNLQIGAGLEYRKSDMDQPGNRRVYSENIDYSYDSDSLDSIPIYLTARYNFRNFTGVTPYVKANLGYSINSGETSVNLNNIKTGKLVEEYNSKMKNKIYYGLGVGIEYKNFLVDLTYDITQSEAEEKIYNYEDKESFSHDYNFDIQKLTLSFGYQFTFYKKKII